MKKNETPYVYKTMSSPVGELKLVASAKGLVAVLWEDDKPNRVRVGEPVLAEKHPILCETEKQLKEYFNGSRTTFDLPLDMRGTDFQKNVWKALLAIPYGTTKSYREIAQQVKRPTAFRAVGAANGRNPLSIVAACHRVIGASGALTGFAGGLKTKAFLLELERGS